MIEGKHSELPEDAMPVDKLTMRRRPEELLQKRNVELDKLSPIDVQSVVQELQVHQIELEMQNEELRRIQQDSRNSHHPVKNTLTSTTGLQSGISP